MKPLNYRTQEQIDAIPIAAVRTYVDQPDIDSKELQFLIVETATDGAGPVGPVSATPTETFKGVAAPAQNIHGAKGTISDVGWAGVDHADLTNTGPHLTANVAMELNINCSVAVVDEGVNNRNTYMLRILHTDSSDVEKYTYFGNSLYLRDDNNDYDSGVTSCDARLFVEVGDKLTMQVEVLDAQTDSGTVNASETYSKLLVQKITYG